MNRRIMDFSSVVSCYVFPWMLILLFGSNHAATESEQLRTYIIHLDPSHRPASFLTHESWHRHILKSLSHPADDEEKLLYSYNHVIHGFSARLTPSQLSEIENSPAHVATYQESFGKLLTTYSSEFLGLNDYDGLLPSASYGEGVIIGILDSGIWPESESFNDKGMPSAPKRWKGQCENGTAFTPSSCNNKLIGAASFSKGLAAAGREISRDHDYDSARDFFGHGSHTSSIAAGNYVSGASYFGYSKGTARGVAPRAHIAMYKVLFATDTLESASTDVLAGMDQAIVDGVDIMSLSLRLSRVPYFNDVIAIASLSAIEKGIVVVCAAGNDGFPNTTFNGAPWIVTVGAGTLDRSFTATLTLENGLKFKGISYFPQSVYIADVPLYYGKDHKNKVICYHGSLNRTEVHGKIVLCDKSTKIDVASQKLELERVGAYGGIFVDDLPLLNAEAYTMPFLVLPTASGAKIKEYAAGMNTPTVKSMRFVSTDFGIRPAPQVAFFSSRGPDPVNPSVLKPDILAPGVDVLAAFIPNRPYMEIGRYDIVTNYAVMSGTSMAAPHVAGVAALLKHLHPEWSPAAIRSAIMTSAYTIDNTGTILKDQWTGHPASPLDFGAGHVNPNKAMDPGFIYDMYLQDYIDFLCSLDYTDKQMKALTRKRQWTCSKEDGDLNYPSFMAIFTNKTGPSSMVKKFSRVVTNVGDDKSIYKATIETPPGMRIQLEPSVLPFTKKYQKLSFTVNVEIDKDVPNVVYGFLKWSDEHHHVVSSPVVAVKF